METPKPGDLSRFCELVESLSEQPQSRIETQINQLSEIGESDYVVSLVRAHFEMSPTDECQLTQGTRLAGRYVIEREIGSGGMGVVYLATQDLTNRPVAIKVIHPRLVSRSLLARFEEEIATLGRLDHEGIVRVYDAGTHLREDGLEMFFFSMQYIEGRTALRYILENEPSAEDILRLMIRVCDAVQAAHDQGVIHRDLKPGNILVDAEGRPRLLDFGLATAAGKLINASHGDAGAPTQLSGTPQYMSPEQYSGALDDFGQGQSIDVYALGVIAFELFAKELPYEFPPDASMSQIGRVVLNQPAKRLDATDAPGIDIDALNAVVGKAIRKDPSSRYFSVASFSKGLRTLLESVAADSERELRAWEPAPGCVVPSTGWVLTRRLGEGGMGDVWLATNEATKRTRVFKFCDDEEKAQTLKREVSLFRLLKERVGNHPHFVRLHDVSLEDSPYYIAMDYVEGLDLASWTDSLGGVSRISLETRISIIIQAAGALQAAHDAGILHRDIKPNNILIEEKDGPGQFPHVYVSDFGIGQLISDDTLSVGGTRLGFTRTVLDGSQYSGAGSHRYMAPELLSGDRATVRSDIYALGVVLYQLIVGNLHAAVPVDWQENIEDPLLREDLARCFRGEPEKRYSSAGELASNLRSLADRRTALERQELEAKRRERVAYRKGVLRAGISIAAFCVLAVWAFWGTRQSRIKDSQRLYNESVAALKDPGADSRARGLQAIRDSQNYYFDKYLFRNLAIEHLAKSGSGSLERSVEIDASTRDRIREAVGWSDDLSFGLFQDDEGQLILRGIDNGELIGSTADESSAPSWGTIESSSVARDGEEVVWIDDTSTAWAWRVGRSDEAPLKVSETGEARAVAVAVHSGTPLIAVGRADGTVAILLGTTGSELGRVKSEGQGPPRFVPASREPSRLAFSPSGRRLAVVSEDSLHVLVWDHTTEQLVAYPYHRDIVSEVVWMDESALLTACGDSNCYLWRIPEERGPERFDQPDATFEAHQTAVRTLAVSDDGARAISVGDKGRAYVWETQSLRVLFEEELGAAPRRAAIADADVYVEDDDRHILKWSLQDSEIFEELNIPETIEAIDIHPSRSEAIVCATSEVYVVDLKNAELVYSVPLRLGMDVDYSAGGSYAIGLLDSKLATLSFEEGSVGRVISSVDSELLDTRGIRGIALSADRKELALVGSIDTSPAGRLQIGSTPAVYLPVSELVDRISYNAWRNLVAIEYTVGRVDLQSLEDQRVIPVEPRGYCSFSADGERLAVRSDQQISLYRLGDGLDLEAEIEAFGPRGPIVIGPRGDWILYVTGDGAIQALSTPDRKPIMELRPPASARVTELTLSSDARHLLARTEQDTIHIWRLDAMMARLDEFALGIDGAIAWD